MDIETLERMLAAGKDSALLRFGLGKGWLDAGDPVRAANHLGRCVVLDPDYSAAWKLLGKAWLAGGQPQAAREAWQRGLSVAGSKGDQQARKEMQVFLRRLDRQSPALLAKAG
ncbi:MAG: tetratricopeptide repeat protein [Stenotrophomonas sp.]